MIRRVRRRASLAAALAAVVALVAPASADAGDLQRAVSEALRGSTASATGVAVAADGMGAAVDIGGNTALPPASTQKLYTGAAALLVLGPERRLRTEVRRTPAPPVDGVLDGDLVLVGSGDPTITGAQLNDLAAQVVAAGITTVTGSLWADDSRYDRQRRVAGWKPVFVPQQSGPLSSVVVDRNAWRRDAAFVADPASPGAGRFRVALQRAGVNVHGGDRLGVPDTGGVPLVTVGIHDSPPLASIVGSMLKSSDNFSSELLLKELGANAGAGTSGAGVDAIWRQAATFGLGPGRATDGSGLSAHDRATAWHEVKWLLAVGRTPIGEMFKTSLPLACGDGTLKQRFCATPAAGRFFAKTGTLPGVVSLAGYGTTASGRRVWFSFLLSGVKSSAQARAAVDRAVNVLAAYRG